MKRDIAIKLLVLLMVVSAFGLEWKWLDYPAARRNARMIVDSLNQRVILFGGASNYTNGLWYNDVWEMPLDTSQGCFWRKLSISGNLPSPRCQHSEVYDQEHQRMVIFGGYEDGNIFNDAWALNLTLGNESWERLNPSGTPPIPRLDHYAIYHPERKSMIVFGGAGNYTRYDDVWELKLDSMVWQEISISGTRPTGRAGGVMMFDQVNNRMIIFGGTSLDYFYNEVWALNLTPGNEQWTQLYPSGSIPQERTGSAGGCDQIRNKFYVFAGWDYNQLFNDLYVLDLNALTWTRLYPTGDLPAERRNPAGVYDYFNDNFFVFGGDDGGSGYFNETFYIYLGAVATPEWQTQPMSGNYPSLFVNTIASGSVRIRYNLPKICNIDVKIMDANGRIVRNLFSGKISSLTDWLYWNTKNNSGKNVSAGVYYCLLETEDTRISKKFVIAK